MSWVIKYCCLIQVSCASTSKISLYIYFLETIMSVIAICMNGCLVAIYINLKAMDLLIYHLYLNLHPESSEQDNCLS